MSLRAVFSPRSIAVIGASHQIGSVGNDIAKHVTDGFKGGVYLVNPKGGQLYGQPVYPSLKLIKGTIDLVIVAVPAALVADVLVQAGKKGIKAAIVLSAGFREVGAVELEKQLVTISQKYRFTLIGPNCLGMMNPHLQLNGSFAPTMPQAGSIAFLSQSGALGVAILDYAAEHGIGFSKFLSVGNQAGIDEAELLEYLANDPDTKVILLYIEQLSSFSRILKVAQKMRRTRHPKPIIALKSGQTQQGARAASSHTGALASSDALYDALFRQAGILRAQTVEDLFLYAECFLYNRLLTKDRVAIVTNAGGLGVLTTDALIKQKLTLAQLSNSTVNYLKKVLPPAASTHNPIDILGDAPADRYQAVVNKVLEDPGVDALAVLLTPQSMTEVERTAEVLVNAKRNSKKPIVVSFLGGDRVTAGADILEEGQMAHASFPERAAQGLAALHTFTLWKKRTDKPPVFRDFNHKELKKIFSSSTIDKEGWLRSDHALDVLEACKIPLPWWMIIDTEEELGELLREKGGKVVLKLVGSSGVHKSDAGAVMLNVDVDNYSKEYKRFIRTVSKQSEKTRVIAMQQIEEKGKEIIVGAIKDPGLGVLVGCGMGGVYTEVFQDAAFNLAPLTPDDIVDILERLKVMAILKGARGAEAADLKSLRECLARVSQLVTQYPQIAEVDINPVLVFNKGKGIIALDARVRVSKKQ